MSITIGVDIGGSHISSAAVNGNDFVIIPGTYFSGAVDSKASKEVIIKKWADIINQTIQIIQETYDYSLSDTIGIAFSMPGPFQYETGIAMFEGNDKYESLYNVSVSEELLKYLSTQNVSFRFLNDASCFGVGGSLKQESYANSKVIAITLGTGFGAAFLDNKLPITQGSNVPHNGCLWDKPFADSIADNYFSTRWFLSQYESITGNKLTDGVKEIAGIEDYSTAKIFDDFANNLSEFLAPFIIDFQADLLILGGNIAKSNRLFLTKFQENLKSKNIDIAISIVENTEQTSILGSSYLFNEVFWERIKAELPYF
ncbi:N-acetyl-D-glucosamine kinase [Flavobacterium bizetiae]|uniref:N-acetyl-D-glucosamine kinase n=1 Tax=Flavobacterium bizetiae TaxID=2704140 RepID=A0A6J4GGL2_9FLAO|nr:ROK family protein [Flavobacterium bizetiae]CAA9198005.1 N-acetyl-D-glucosamine kinase [Flavobacterium bizetiae]CAD5340290.1 N-acetyl-D-glucosamine kinase [Flavobacterium bizetiae]CAD5346244.1 N-acetyl-D-glucosamine kinase [Flavobacterium bizetiae]